MPKHKQYPRTPDGRYFVVRGRLWRLSNPELGEEERERLIKALMRARSSLRGAKAADRPKVRARIDKAKRALGERGPVWWTDGAPDFNRHLAKNTPYADWWAKQGQ
jgi:hypothetical protein